VGYSNPPPPGNEILLLLRNSVRINRSKDIDNTAQTELSKISITYNRILCMVLLTIQHARTCQYVRILMRFSQLQLPMVYVLTAEVSLANEWDNLCATHVL
jgi:hypothetical protein